MNNIKVQDLPFDLQLFAGEKTEPATEKRREEARESGNIVKSQDAEAVVVMFVAFITLWYFGPQMMAIMMEYLRFTLSQNLAIELSPLNLMHLIDQFMTVSFKILAPFLLAVLFAAIGGNLYQTGFHLSFDPLLPDINRMNPISGLENMLSWKSLGELFKAFMKIGLVAYIPYATIRDQMPMLVRFVQIEPLPAMILLLKIIFWMVMKILTLLGILAIGDYYFQLWRYEENLKMSKEEIKEEYKQREGDPKVKAKIRERQRRLANKRMMEEVPKATVVVTNPTHIAVAIRYEESSKEAPKVVALGTGLIAQKIKEVAREHDVPIIENKPLAQALHKMVDVGDEIPQDLWQTVAEIFVQVYKLKKQAA